MVSIVFLVRVLYPRTLLGWLIGLLESSLVLLVDARFLRAVKLFMVP